MISYRDLLPIAQAGVALAADLLRTQRPTTVTSKGDRDMATEVDYDIERQVRSFLHQKTPQISFLGEEEGASGASHDLVWTLDPIDGTANFVHNSPLCGVSLGLVAQGLPVLGVIDLPFLRTRYTAVQGDGARANNEPIRASITSDLHESIVAIGDYAVGDQAADKNRTRLAITSRLAAQAQRVRMHGSAALDLAWLACGRLDAVVIMENNPWDMAAGVVIAQEAGAQVVDLDGSPYSVDSAVTIGATRELLADILGLVNESTVDAFR